MRYLVVGMGLSGWAVARRLRGEGCDFDLFDNRGAAVFKGQEDWRAEPVTCYDQPHEVALARYGQVVLSPGVALDHPVVAAAKQAGVEVIGEVEFAYRRMAGRGQVVAVTGSNGKSTTVSLLHHILVAAGHDAVLCGNIGTPFTAALRDVGDPIYVLEVSSFQMETIVDFKARVACFLNLSPDHLDRHKTTEAYGLAKARIFENQDPGDLAIVCAEWAPRIPGKGRKLVVPSDQIGLTEHAICAGADMHLPLDQVVIKGRHNWENLLFSALAVQPYGVTASQILAALPSFCGLEHRFETVGQLDGVLWINDTKATNVHATNAALGAMTQPYVLILGGSKKGDDPFELEFGSVQPRQIVCYGETGPQLMHDLSHLDPVLIPEFESACRYAHDQARPGDALLLAPACASFDQFENFKARGLFFKELFQRMSQTPKVAP